MELAQKGDTHSYTFVIVMSACRGLESGFPEKLFVIQTATSGGIFVCACNPTSSSTQSSKASLFVNFEMLVDDLQDQVSNLTCTFA